MPTQPPVTIIEHADVKRMLLAQKSYVEGSLALELYCARLVDEQHTGNATQCGGGHALLEVLTPVAKSFPSEWCLEANSLAIQVLGGYGYTRDFPVEQHWRDNRLNMIHEGTHGIQGARSARAQGADERRRRAAAAARPHARDRGAGSCVIDDLTITRCDLDDAVAAARERDHATPGHQRARRSARQCDALPAGVRPRGDGVAVARHRAARSRRRADPFANGKRGAMGYFFAYELPKIDALARRGG